MSKKAKVKNAADEEQIKKAEKSDRFDRNHELKDIEEVLKTTAGRRWIWRILSECGLYKTCKGIDDAHTNMNVGAQNIGHMILFDIVEADEKLLFAMMQERMVDDSKKE
jgi:hypothetical protein